MMASTAQTLPPNLAAEYTHLAKEGKADVVEGKEIYIFYRAQQEIVIVADNCGHFTKLSEARWAEIQEMLTKKEQS